MGKGTGKRRVALAAALAVVSACRGYHDPVPFDECQPYPLACADCPLDDELGDAPQDILRYWRSEDPALGAVDAVRRRAVDADADDTHFYDDETGLRVAAVRTYDAPVDLCGVTVDDEWWGAILDLADLCEHEPSRPDADPALPACDDGS